jgi:hypothetical protein
MLSHRKVTLECAQRDDTRLNFIEGENENNYPKHEVGRECMIIDKIKNLKGMDDLKTYSRTSDRFDTSVSNNMLPFAKRIKDKARNNTDRTAIDTGILSELYNYGITKEQLSNLKALADYMGAKYHKSDGKMIVEITNEQFKAYFVEEDERTQGTEGT